MYMLGAKYGFAQSMDCAAQTMDPYFMRQSMDFVRNPWIARIEVRQVQIRGQSMCIALRKQLIAWFTCRSKDKLKVSGVALAS